MNAQSFPKLGEVWYVKNLNQPDDPHQPRTAVIVSTNGRNEAATDVIVVPTTSSTKFEPHPYLHVQLPSGQGGLSKNSIARCDKVTTLDKRLLVNGPLGDVIHINYRSQIIHAIRRALGDTAV